MYPFVKYLYHSLFLLYKVKDEISGKELNCPMYLDLLQAFGIWNRLLLCTWIYCRHLLFGPTRLDYCSVIALGIRNPVEEHTLWKYM